jgi:hypothetical protein
MSLIALPSLFVLTGLALLIVVLLRKRSFKALCFTLVAIAGAGVFLLTPVCQPIPDEALRGFAPPIEEREERNFYGLKTFQLKEGRWHHCKSWMARLLFA